MSTIKAVISQNIIDDKKLAHEVAGQACGAVLTFLGTVRDNSLGKKVEYLIYEAYEPMALNILNKIMERTLNIYELESIVIYHRVGRVNIGEVSLGIGVSAPHRKDAILALDSIIDQIKSDVPIWKHEYWEGGAYWIEGMGSSCTVIPCGSIVVE